MRLFVDHLTNVDFSYLCATRGLVGETWLASIELSGPLDEQGMVCDFGIVKKALRQWLDDTLDHKLLLPCLNHLCDVRSQAERVDLQFGELCTLSSPAEAVALLAVAEISPASVARWCEAELGGMFGDAVEAIHLRFEPELINGPFYHYSHGLKKHNGNCQRIAHGHRSKILIWQNDELAPALMTAWADNWRDSYLATRADCVAHTDVACEFHYLAPQGEFALRLPTARCHFLTTDTTVEHIAQHIANELAAAHPGEHFRVKAYEGISKGAIAEAKRSR